MGPVDISGMPDPHTIGLADDPTEEMPSPEDLYRQYHFGNTPRNANGKFGPMEPIPKDLVDDFIENPPRMPTAGETVSRLSGLPRAAAGLAAAPVAGAASIVGQGLGALDAAAALGTGDTKLAGEALERGRQRGRDWAGAVNEAAAKVPATKLGGEFANDVLSAPAGIIKESADSTLGRVLPDNAYQAVKDIGQDVGTDLQAFGLPGEVKFVGKAAKAGYGAGKRFVAGERASLTPSEPAPADRLTPPVGSPLTGEQLRAQPNPIPPPGAEPPTAAQEPTAAPPSNPTAPAAAAQPPANAVPTLPLSDAAPQDMSLSPQERALVREGVAARRANERGSVRLFNSPKDEGPQETPAPETVPVRQGHLDAIDQLSGGRLPTRRTSALTGDYNATGNDWQMAKTGNEKMQGQLAQESDALHAATENVHSSIGSEFENSSKPEVTEDRARVVRGALKGIEGHFDDLNDRVYDIARAVHGPNPMPQFLTRASGFLNDQANYMPDGFRRSALARLEQLKTVGDNGDGTPNSGATPSSVGAAEKFREWLNANRTLDNAHVVKQLKNHVDTDVADHGGPGLFKNARDLRTHKAQMMEEPKLVSQLLTANDSQGINHAVPDAKVMDHIADAPSEQVAHLMKVLKAGAHMSPELAESSAAAIREIQAHLVSKMHDAATGDGGKWNARTFYNSAAKYATKIPSVFESRPDVIKNLKTINDAGNTLHMDKSYPGAAGQTARSGILTAAAGVAGKGVASLAHDIPLAGRYIGRAIENATEAATGEMGKKSLEKQAAKKIVDRSGKQTGSAPIFNNASGESPASLEAQSRVSDENARGRTRHLIDPDGNVTPLTGVDAVDRAAPKGSVIYQKGVGILDRGGLPQGQAAGLVNRARANGFDINPQPLGARMKSQAGRVKVVNGKEEYEANPSLEKFVHEQAPPHRVDENGPANWEELQARRGEKVMPINPQSSENSIYSNQKTNIAFRAWHDKLHLDLNAGFDHDGELKVALEHQRQAKAAGLNAEDRHALWADTWETFKHHEDTGNFPSEPRSFVAEHMKSLGPPDGSTLNIGLHQGVEGENGFRKMSKQEAQKAVESTGAKVTKTSVLTPQAHGVSEPTAVVSTDRPLSNPEMQGVLAKTKQSAIPQRTGQGDETMHVAPGHEERAKAEGWDTFNPDYFREHNGQTASDAMTNPKNIHPNSTVKNPRRSAYPGIYDDPMDTVLRASTVPESTHLKDIFGTTREEMHDAVIKQGDVPPKTPMPGMAPKGKGSAHAQQITTPENATRLKNIIAAFKEAAPDAYHGMVAWYHMEPMYQSIKKILGGDEERASDVYHKLNTYTSLSSPMSSVEPEIRRGTAAATMAAEGNFQKYARWGGKPTSRTALQRAPELQTAPLGIEGHAFHSTSQAPALSRFTQTGQEADAVKTGAYRRASDAPSRPGSDYQNTVLVGDSHFSRGVGLSDVRGAAAYDGSIEGPELKVVHPWYHEEVAKPSGIPATSAQAVQWAALSHETGVETAIGAPKLEIFANEIAKAARKADVSPKEYWERIVKRLAAK